MAKQAAATLEQAHRRIAALEKDFALAKELGGSITETRAWESDEAPADCPCPEAEAARRQLGELRRRLAEAEAAKDAAEVRLARVAGLLAAP